ncbi:hypothetical protein BU24DRAFT_347894 [Aaosphaeria arxii CBS 175.79]|uniref:YTH domain-containing protein n=1 Tax=Aaosphaeria arxii CBS 175.79 TaxID=1450172 RepID=A0A6A5XN71_9PLEO|nr:uncharacterized protein BU24DRAFT_347894 [Aaosphaeria arxii CBS 175.79]KAF2014688.1 hypothetical protein BU24DRAFT_347894 [Aaosphaeria arxii CBS 175.79]
MAFVWVQQWIALPVVIEDQMGDVPPGTGPPTLDASATGLAHDEHQIPSFKSSTSNVPFQSQLSTLPQGQARPDLRSPTHLTGSHYRSQELGASPLNMGPMVGALPEYSSVDSNQAMLVQQAQRPLSGASTSALVYQLGQNLQMPNHPASSMQQQMSYGSGFAPGQYQHGFVPAQNQQHPSFNPYQAAQRPLHYPNVQPSQYLYYPSPYGHSGQFPQGYPQQAVQAQTMYGRRPSLNNPQMQMMGQAAELSPQDGNFGHGNRMMHGGLHAEHGSVGIGSLGTGGMNRSGPVSSIPRGPPRKPKQSGHALWVGNLPPGTTVIALKDHFSRDATKEIESLFLISKSNCAFVNYRTEASCTAAMHRFHDSRFNGVRLVCRLRRSSTAASGVPTGPSAMVGSVSTTTPPPASPQATESDEPQTENAAEPVTQEGETGKQAPAASEKYFIVKSLTLQDLELSVRNGIWATQSHNEDVLNKAYQTAENVYLIFSANKSGEYFGYARMSSPILEEAKDLITPTPKPEVVDTTDVPKSIPTPATEFAPKGRIIDDSARGTIFWEAELEEEEEETQSSEQQQLQIPESDASVVAQSWGKPFKIEWISTNRLPFYRTRGLRNPWNANREVKIARDGTELETSVGERLIQMFHRIGPPSAAGPSMIQAAQLGPAQMRPF